MTDKPERQDQPYVIIIRSGPIYFLDRNLGHFAEEFGRHYEGEVLTWSDHPEEFHRAGFLVRAYSMGRRSWGARLMYTLRLVSRGLRARWVEGRDLVVITYDPFQSGVAGLLMKWLAGASFICEVNGIYGHPDTLVDMHDQDQAAKKRRKMLRVGSFILRRADRIKLLFPEQLIGFDLDDATPPRTWFHDMINAPLFEPSIGEPPDKTILFVGHPYLLKGVDLLLEAFGRLSADFPNWRLILVGWGLRDAAEQQHGFPPRHVHFIQSYPQEYLSILMERCAAVVLPSRSEGMGRVLLEAAFLGRPRIGSRIGGIPYVIEHDVDGLLFDGGDSDDLERVLRRFMADPILQAELGAAARIRAQGSFTNTEYVRRYQELIGELCNPT